MSSRHTLERKQIVAAPLHEVCAFFEDPRNLSEITPPFLNFQIKTEGDLEMKVGARVDYTIRLHGVPMLWKTLIEEYEPGSHFVDFQLQGPYKLWRHLHTFRAVPGGTEIVDHVTYELPLGPLGSAAHALFVKRQLNAIFDYRFQVVEDRFGSLPQAA